MSYLRWLVIPFVAAGILGYIVTLYKGLIAAKNNLDKAWANVDALLKQRHDELPNLIQVCRGYMKYEADTFQRIAEARLQYAKAGTVDQKVDASSKLSAALGKLIAAAENYPGLHANSTFAQMQSLITEIESEIADRREFYNDTVRAYNARIKEKPDAILARHMGLVPRRMFRFSESEKAPVSVFFANGSR